MGDFCSFPADLSFSFLNRARREGHQYHLPERDLCITRILAKCVHGKRDIVKLY